MQETNLVALVESIDVKLDTITLRLDAQAHQLEEMNLKLSFVQLVLSNIALAQAIENTDKAIAKNRARVFFFSRNTDIRLVAQREALVAHAEIGTDLLDSKVKQLAAAA